jgi:hypothetical protein
VVYILNFKGKPTFLKEEGAYKIIDDFRKVRLFEVDCAVSCRNFRSSFGNIREENPGNGRLASGLGGRLMFAEELTKSELAKNMDFVAADLYTTTLASVSEQAIQQLGVKKAGTTAMMLAPLNLQPAPMALEPAEKLSLDQYVVCRDYPRLLTLTSLDLLRNLRYSCGWVQVVDPPGDLAILYSYTLFDMSLFYSLKRVSTRGESFEMEEREIGEMRAGKKDEGGTFEVRILVPPTVKDSKESKRLCYEIVKDEAKSWDDIMSLCQQMVILRSVPLIKDCLLSRALVAENLIAKINDQKSTK